LVCQLPKGVTFAYDLHMGRSRDRWKGLVEEYNKEKGLHYACGNGVCCCDAKKRHLGPQNGPESLGPEKLPN
jgi:hypothetical protein